MASITKDKKSHRDRKNPKSAEAYRLSRHAKNADRPKQTFVQGLGWVR